MSARRLASQDGFSIVELLLAMTIGLIVLSAALGVFDSFNRGTASATRLTDAEDAGRRHVGKMVRILRDAGAPAPVTGAQPTTVTRALGNDLVFLSTSWPDDSATGSAGNHVQRLCVNTTTGVLWFDGLRYPTTGPADPGSACPSTATGWTHTQLAAKVANSTLQPLFTFAGTTPVRSAGISLRLEGGTTTRSRPLALKSGGTLRGALAPQLNSGDVTVECNSDGSGTALLSVASNLKLSASGAITAGPGQIVVDTTAASTFALTVTNVLGLQTLLFKDVSCP